MSHDLIAELAGYRAELAGAEQHNKTERAAAVREQIDRVEAAAVAQVAKLVAQADNHEAAQEDLAAATARGKARTLANALPADRLPANLRRLRGDAADGGPAPQETAEQNVPHETATRRTTRKGS